VRAGRAADFEDASRNVIRCHENEIFSKRENFFIHEKIFFFLKAQKILSFTRKFSSFSKHKKFFIHKNISSFSKRKKRGVR